MFQGYYNLTSSVLTQTRNLNVISNNMSNVSTPGYKSDEFITASFEEVLAYRSNNKPMVGAAEVGSMGTIVTADRNYTDYAQAGLELTGRSLDFALEDDGFFTIASEDGNVYTRNGSFSLDDEGYLVLQGVGRVQGLNGDIQLGIDDIVADSLGNIYDGETDELLGSLAIVNFEDYDLQLEKATSGVFSATAAAQAINGTVMQGALESSNVDIVQQMTDMMASSRALQSSAQIMTMYDTLIGKMVSQLGPV